MQKAACTVAFGFLVAVNCGHASPIRREAGQFPSTEANQIRLSALEEGLAGLFGESTLRGATRQVTI